jgi:RimJ/RimL family protein N-acetyltransferase
MPRTNEFNQPIGPALPGWTARPLPPRTPMTGRFVRLEPLDAQKHAADIFEANAGDDGSGWTYMFSGPFPTLDEYRAWCEAAAKIDDPLQFAIVDQTTNKAVGTASFMRIDPKMGAIEVGNIKYSPKLQRTPLATEAMFLMMRRAFDELGYRRYEWKCDNFNEPSKKAATRLGFTFEGIFRNAVIYKGRSRDTAWFSITDAEWKRLKGAYEHWLAPENFDADGQQKRRLAAIIEPAR